MPGMITKLTQENFKSLAQEFRFFKKRDILTKIIALRNAQSDRDSVLADLYQMLDTYNIFYEVNKTADYYQQIVEQSDLTDYDVDVKIINRILSDFRKYPLTQDFLERLVRRLDGDSQESLRIRILKRFITHGDYLSAVGYGGKTTIENYVMEKNHLPKRPDIAVVARLLDEGIFNVLTNNATVTADQLKPSGKFGLIRVAHDLANGFFRTMDSSKFDLYMFAIVYGMTYNKDPATDIEKNIFEDIYVNNVMTTSLSGNYDQLLNERGINYKNFAEMTLLYVIQQNISSQEKLQLYATIINGVQQRQKRKRKRPIVPPAKSGIDDINKRIFQRKITQFEDYLVQNFDCNLQRTSAKGIAYTIGVMQAQAEQRSALQAHSNLLLKLKNLTVSLVETTLTKILDNMASQNKKVLSVKKSSKIYEEYWIALNCAVSTNLGGSRNFVENDNYKETLKERKESLSYELNQLRQNIFVGNQQIIKKLQTAVEKVCTKIDNETVEKIEKLNDDLIFDYGIGFQIDMFEELTKKSQQEEFNEFLRIIENVDQLLKNKNIFDSNHVSRTTLLALFYYYYNLREKMQVQNLHQNFAEYYSDFKQNADVWLDAALYKKLDSRFLYDIILVLGSYAYSTGGMIYNN